MADTPFLAFFEECRDFLDEERLNKYFDRDHKWPTRRIVISAPRANDGFWRRKHDAQTSPQVDHD